MTTRYGAPVPADRPPQHPTKTRLAAVLEPAPSGAGPAVADPPLDSTRGRIKMGLPMEHAPTIEHHPADALGWISLAALALVLGRTHARAARDWCNRHGVAYRRDGKHNFARLDDVRRALEGLPLRDDDAGVAQARAAATRATAAIMAARRR